MQEQICRKLMETTNDGLWVIDSEGLVVFANQKLSHMLGYRPEELRTATVYDIHPGGFVDEVLRRLGQMGHEDTAVIDEVPLQSKQGSIFPFDVTCTALIIDGRRYLMGVFRDAEKRIQSEERRDRLNDHLEGLILERTRQLEAVVAELESEIMERRQAESILRQSRCLTNESFDEIIQSLTYLQSTLRNMVYSPSEDVKFRLGDLHVLVEDILEKLRKGNPALP
jgi:PAS domain S-box-containing protein